MRAWTEPAVTLLGDAIHTMSPGRGDGANVALGHAALLPSLLGARSSLAEAELAYERRTLRDGFAAVERSREGPLRARARRRALSLGRTPRPWRAAGSVAGSAARTCSPPRTRPRPGHRPPPGRARLTP
ncbi:FAD-dependent monooxygenase [Nonomuraea sp. NPDC049309]|uniref:FAD-dependent monooxygenase n=1 Tax=Nonomuraea sp. NPDC049309 TaxID=3364350 RepID=UPI003716BE35